MFFRLCTLIAIACLAIYWFHIRLQPEDALCYAQLTHKSALRHKQKALEKTPARQTRQCVSKEIFSDGMHLQIQSEESELSLAQRRDKIEAVETVKGVACQWDDNCTFQADQGEFHLASRQFSASDHCQLQQGENEINGTHLHIDLMQEILTYDNPVGKLAEGPLHFSARQLIWHKKEGTLELIDTVNIEQPSQFVVMADHGSMCIHPMGINQLQPTHLILKGNVRLISSRTQDKPSYACADTLVYNLVDKTLLFSSEKRVLFWQEGLSLSAPEVLIRPNQTIEGHGDIHFTFDLEEQNYIDEVFKQYL